MIFDLGSLWSSVKKNAKDIDSLATQKQDASTAITSSNIGNQSVNYATSAGSAGSATNASKVPFTGITSMPNKVIGIRDYSWSTNVAADSINTVSFACPKINGYTPVGIVGHTTSYPNTVFFRDLSVASNGTLSGRLVSTYGQALSTTLHVYILYVSTSYGGGFI